MLHQALCSETSQLQYISKGFCIKAMIGSNWDYCSCVFNEKRVTREIKMRLY